MLPGMFQLEPMSLTSMMGVMIKEIYVRTKKEPPKQKMNQQPKPILRFLRIRGGTVASSPFQNCTPANAIASTPEITKRATILPVQVSLIDLY